METGECFCLLDVGKVSSGETAVCIHQLQCETGNLEEIVAYVCLQSDVKADWEETVVCFCCLNAEKVSQEETVLSFGPLNVETEDQEESEVSLCLVYPERVN